VNSLRGHSSLLFDALRSVGRGGAAPEAEAAVAEAT
jgi:hypothetical protein